MVGGDEAIFQRCKPVLDAIGDGVTYSGAIGSGTVCKLVHNCISACLNIALGEGFTLGVKAGVDPKALWEAVRRASLGRANSIHVGFPSSVLKGEFAPRPNAPTFFALKLLRKDVGLATQLAREYDVPMAMAAICEQQLVEGIRRGWGEDSSFKVVALQEERAGVQVRAPDIEV